MRGYAESQPRVRTQGQEAPGIGAQAAGSQRELAASVSGEMWGSAGGNPSAQTLNWFACGCIISHKNAIIKDKIAQ